MATNKKPRSRPAAARKAATRDDLQTELDAIRLAVAYCVMQLDDQEPHPSDARRWRLVRRTLYRALGNGGQR